PFVRETSPDTAGELAEVLADMPKILTRREHGVLLLHALSYQHGDHDPEDPTRWIDGEGAYDEIAGELSTGNAVPDAAKEYQSILDAVTDERGVAPITKQAIQQTVVRAQKKLRAFYQQ